MPCHILWRCAPGCSLWTSTAFRQQRVGGRYLTQSFHPSEAPAGGGLAISGGLGGARLTHNHSRQFAYVLQSLTLWCASDTFCVLLCAVWHWTIRRSYSAC